MAAADIATVSLARSQTWPRLPSWVVFPSFPLPLDTGKLFRAKDLGCQVVWKIEMINCCWNRLERLLESSCSQLIARSSKLENQNTFFNWQLWNLSRQSHAWWGRERKETGVEQLFVLPIWQGRDSYLSAAAVSCVVEKGEGKGGDLCKGNFKEIYINAQI